MRDDDHSSPGIKALRQQAEARLSSAHFAGDGGTTEELRSLLHELKVYQIEIELQNEDLRTSQHHLEQARDRAEDVRDQFMRLFHDAPVGYAAVDRSGMLLEVNHTLRRMLAMPLEGKLEHRSFADLLQPSDGAIFRARFPAFFDQPSEKRMELRLRSQEEHSGRWIEITGRPVSWTMRQSQINLSNSQLLIVVSDIGERKRLEGELTLAAQVFEYSAEGIAITTADGTILRVNPAFSLVTGYSADEVLGRNPSLLQSGRHDPGFYAAMWEAIRLRGRWAGEIWNRKKNGDIYVEWLSISAVRDSAGTITHFIAIFSDISERKRAEEEMERLAHYDMLTGLPNRVLFHERLEQALAQSKRYGTWLAVMLLDLDRFKEVNDQLGHDVGDLLLQQVALRLNRTLRASDTLARLGGDEFIALLPSFDSANSAMAGASVVAGHVACQLTRPFDLNGHKISTSTSMGIAIAPQDGESLTDLIKHADTAMYSAKAKGRNTCQFFSPAMHEQSRQRSRIEQGLRQALDRQEFVLLFQPVVELCSERIVALEALLRWRQENTLRLPAEFLTVAEETGVIVDIGAWVIDQACAQIARLARNGASPPRIALNLSPRQLLAPQRLLQQLTRAMSAWNTSPEWLEIEIREGLLLQEAGDAQRALHRIKDLGVRLTLDDFGTGHASLTSLRRCPVDTVKIDRSFINNIGRNRDNEAIISAVLALANSMHFTCVAEGIEHENQFRFLVDNGCTLGQGHYYWHPLPKEGLEAVVGEQSACKDDPGTN